MKRCLTVLALAWLPPVTAAAQPTGRGVSATPDELRAEAFAEKGKKEFEAGHFTTALQLFDEAFAAFPDPKYFTYKGLVYEGLGRPLDAAAEYERYLSSQAIEPTRAKDARDALRDLDKHLGKLRITVVGPTGAELSIGGAAWGPVPAAPVRILPGAYEVRARGAGHPTPVVVTGKVEAGRVVDVKVDVTPPTPAQLMDSLLADGAALAAAGDHAAVIERFSAAYDENKEPRLIPGLAAAHAALGHDLEAAGWCERYLAGQPRDPVVEEAVRTQLAAVDARLGHLAIVAAGVDGVEIQIGEGAWIALPPEPVRVAPGAYRVRGRVGPRSVTAEGIAAAGQVTQVELALSVTATPVATTPSGDIGLHRARAPSRWSALAGGIGTVGDRGVRGVVGVGFRPIPRLRLGVDAILGKGPGLAPGATYYLVGDRLQPFVQASLPLRWLPSAEGGCGADCGMEVYGRCGGSTVSSIEAAGRLGVGVAWRLGDRTALHASAGLERYPFADGCRFSPTVVTPSLGLEARL